MKTIFLLLVSLTVALAAPRRQINTYDQRQDGTFNIHAKLDNFLFVFVPPSTGSLEIADLVDNPLVAAALDLKNVDSRNAAQSGEHQSSDSHRRAEISSIPEAEAAISIINSEAISEKKIEDDESSAKIIAIVKEDRPIEAVSSSQSSGSTLEENKNNDVKGNLAKSEVHSKKARSLKNRYSDTLSVSKLPPRNSGLEPSENKVTVIAGKDRKNYVGSAEREPQLLGGGIENCGPERFRNRWGICQFLLEA